jgi:HSP20 family molecular chaperone IbpA
MSTEPNIEAHIEAASKKNQPRHLLRYVLIGLIAVLVAVAGLEAWSIASLKSELNASRGAPESNQTQAQVQWARPMPPDVVTPGQAPVMPGPVAQIQPFFQMAPGSGDPFDDLQQMQQQMQQQMNQMLAMTMSIPQLPVSVGPGSTVQDIAMNVEDQPDRYVVHITGPELNPDTVNVSLNGQELTVSYTSESQSGGQGPNGQGAQRQSVTESFRRAVVLPEPVDGQHATTSVQNGEFQIVIPKAGQGHSV